MLFPERLNPPPLISGLMLLQGSERESFARIARLERPPPNLYLLARQLFAAVIEGQDWEWAVRQAAESPDKQQAAQAGQLLKVCKTYLQARQGLKAQEPPSARWHPGSDLSMPLPCHAVVGPERTLAIFHCWKTELPADRLPLLKRALRQRLWELPGFAGVGIELVTAPFIEAIGRRSLRVIRCDDGECDPPEALDQFGERLVDVWDRYHVAHPHRRKSS